MIKELHQKFKAVFGQNGTQAFFAPGRVNLIGEHIDYNGGLVMPCAITHGTYLITAPNNTGTFRFRSTDFDEILDIPLKTEYTKQGESWFNYPLGVIHHLLALGHQLKGIDFLFYGNVPIGSGLSSSASIEVVTAFALNEIFNCGISKLDIVKLTKVVENKFIGVNSGIMDQFAVTFGERNKALRLDCETLDYQAVDCNLGDNILAIVNSNKPRKLSESKYNERVQECEEALSALQTKLDIQNLCDIDAATFDSNQNLISNEVVRNRAKHVVEENERVKLAEKALATNDLTEFGRLMYASHDSLKNLYEVSGVELDTLVEFCIGYPDVIGARMTGAGFGGCAIALVKKDSFIDFSEKISAYYSQKIGYAPSVYNSLIGDGVQERNLGAEIAE